MNIGLDWDETVTEDVDTFMQLITLFRSAGHAVFIVTARAPENAKKCEQVLAEYNLGDVPVYGTTYRAKMPFMKAAGVRIDVWIDDHPPRLLIDEVAEADVLSFRDFRHTHPLRRRYY